MATTEDHLKNEWGLSGRVFGYSAQNQAHNVKNALFTVVPFLPTLAIISNSALEIFQVIPHM